MARRWTADEDKELTAMLDAGQFASEIGLKLNRTPSAIYARLYRSYEKRTPAETARDLEWRANDKV